MMSVQVERGTEIFSKSFVKLYDINFRESEPFNFKQIQFEELKSICFYILNFLHQVIGLMLFNQIFLNAYLTYI